MLHKERLSEFTLACVMASGFMELGLYSYPRQLAEDPTRRYYLSLLLATLLGALLALACAYLATTFPRKSVVQIGLEVLGRPLGTLAAIWLIGFHIFLGGVCLRYFGDVINAYFLPRTPPEVIMLLVVVAVIYINTQGLAGMSRFVTATFPIVIVLLFVAFGLTASRLTETDAAFPTPRGFDPAQVLHNTGRILYLFVGIESIMMLLPLVGKAKRPYLTVVAPILVNGALLLIDLVVTLGVLGIETTAQLENPGIIVLRILRLPGLLVERLGGLIALAWTALKIGYLCVRFVTVPMATAQIFKLSIAEYRKFLVPVAILVFFVARLPPSLENLIEMLEYWVGPVGFASNMGMVLLLLLVARLRGMGRESQ